MNHKKALTAIQAAAKFVFGGLARAVARMDQGELILLACIIAALGAIILMAIIVGPNAIIPIGMGFFSRALLDFIRR